MADNQQYPDSNGARWEAPATGQQGPAERPAFLDRTAPMSRQDREARAQDTSMDDLIGSRNRTSRLPSQDRAEEQVGGFGVPQPPAPQWNPEPATAPPPPPQQQQQFNEPSGDPELAAMSRMDAPRQVSPPMPPPEAHRQPMAQPSPPPDLNEPTQLHNPVSGPPPAQQQQQRGGTYGSSQSGGGVYQSNTSNLGSLAWIAAFVIAVPILYVMIRALSSGADVILSGAVASGMFALAGLPLTAFGLQASLKHKPGPEGISPLRAPYVYLVTGLVLILAAGMAAG